MKKYILAGFFFLCCFVSIGQSFTQPSISRDGKFLVFGVEKNGERALYISNSDGTNIKFLIDIKGSELSPNWSPDGEMVVFYGIGDGDERDIYTVEKNGKSLNNLTKGSFKNVQTTSWTVDNRIIFSYGEFPSVNVYSMSTRGLELTPITNHEQSLSYYADMNGDALVYGHASRSKRGIFYRSHADAEVIQLTNSGEAPVISPNGTQIAYQDGHDTGTHIFLVDKDGKNKRRLTNEYSSELPEWSPDGQSIFFQRKVNGLYEIWKIDLKSEKLTPIINNVIFEKNK